MKDVEVNFPVISDPTMEVSRKFGMLQPGDDVIVPPPGSCGVAKDRMEKRDQDVKCLDWFMCLKKCPHK